MPAHDPILFVLSRPQGLHVCGVHDASHAPVDEALHPAYEKAHARWLAKIASTPGGFDGHRAALQHFELQGDSLCLQTAYRSYTQGRALRDAWVAHNPEGLAEAPLRPHAGASWGMSLVTLVLLPFDHVLCGQRSLKMLVNPGLWTAGQTEVIEPSDIAGPTMSRLLERLTDEEMPSLAGLGTHRFIGLGVRATTYTWQLVSVLDLREAGAAALDALSKLKADEETAAWCAWPLSDQARTSTSLLPANLSPEGVAEEPLDVALARQILALA